MSDTTIRESAVSGMNRIAMYAVAQHMLDHKLPAPISLGAPHACDHADGSGAVMVVVPTSALDAWVDPETGIDVQQVESHPVGAARGLVGWEAVEHRGRLETPVGLIPICVKVLRRVPEPPAPDLRLVGTEVPC